MLGLIRNKKNTPIVRFVFWAIIAAFIGTIFLVWGKGGPQKGPQQATALIINDHKVSLSDYQDAYRTVYQLYSSIYNQSMTPQLAAQLGLKRQALDRVINNTLILDDARNQGISVSRDELVQEIAKQPAFQVNGAYNRDQYLKVLNYQKLKVAEFETSVEQQLLASKYLDQVKQGIVIDDAELLAAFHKENDQINLQFVQLTGGLFDNKVTVTEEALQAFFDNNKEQFRIPEKVALRYLTFDPAQYRSDIAPFNDEEIDRYYRRNLDQFEIQEQVKASHLLVRVPDGASDSAKAEKHALAEKYLADIRAGEDFAEMARLHSDDPGSAATGGDLGYFPRGAMIGPFEDTAFALAPGQVSDLVETPYGFHIIKVTGHIDGGVKPLVDVIDQVKEGLTTEHAQQLAYEKAMDAYNLNRKEGSLEKAAETSGLAIAETPAFARDEPMGALGNLPEINQAAFALQEGQLSHPIQTTTGTILFSLKERLPSHIPELADVRPQVEAAFRQVEGAVLASAKAKALAQKLAAGGSLAQLAADEHLTVEETGLFSQSYGSFVPKLGNAPELATAAFALTADKPASDRVFDLQGKQVVIALKDTRIADEATLDDAKKATLRQRLLSQKGQALVEEKVKALREKANILIDPQFQSYLDEDK